MESPPSSPFNLNISHGSSRPSSSPPRETEFSPPSSPLEQLSPPRKRRTWHVYLQQDTDRELCKATSWRWKSKGLGPEDSDESDHQNQNQDDETFDKDEPAVCAENDLSPAGPNSTNDQLCVCVEDNYDHSQIPEDSQQVFVSDESMRSRASSESSVWSGASDSSGVPCIDSDLESSFGNQSEAGDVNINSDSDGDSNSNHSVSSEESFEVYNGCEHSVDEAVLDLLTNNIDNFETKASLKNHLETFLKYLPKRNNMPKTVTQLLNYVEQLVPFCREIPYKYCSKCCLLIDNEGPCQACESIERNVFYLFSLEEQIRFYFENRNLGEMLDKYRCCTSSDGLIRDIVDGAEYLRVNANEKYSLTLMMNTDGVSISKSSKKKLWPVMFVICELPPFLRKRFMIVGGVWCDDKDAPMNVFMMPVVDGLLKINREGGVLWTHPCTEVEHRSEVSVPLVCADAPARAKIQNIKSHSAKQGCNTCEQHMVTIPLTAVEIRAKAAGQKNIRRKRGYVFQEEPALLRTDSRMRRQAREAFNTKTAVQGVKGPSIVACIPKLKISTCVYAEYMHGTCLGCVKYFLQLMLTVSGPWNISKFKSELDTFMKNITPFSDIFRLPRPLSDFVHWKASEFRSWLLFYSLVCLKGKLPDEYFKHWCLLVNAIFLLLKEEISEENLNEAETMLKQFVKDVGRLYSIKNCTYNVHQLIHLPRYVKLWGPLWSTSAFQFESYNGTLAKLIHGSKNPGKELMRNIRVALGVEILRNKVLDTKTPGAERRGSFELLNHGRGLCIPEADLEVISAFCGQVPVTKMYLRVRRGNTIFTSKLYTREKKRSNYTVKFKSIVSSGYGDIKYFILCDNEVYVVIGKLRINHADIFYDQLGFEVRHILPVEESYSCTVVIKLDDIVMKVLRVGNTVCHLPNGVEKNL